VENLLPTNVEGDAWLGLAELVTDNSLRWTDASLITYKNLISQPKTNRGSMECVAMSIGGCQPCSSLSLVTSLLIRLFKNRV